MTAPRAVAAMQRARTPQTSGGAAAGCGAGEWPLGQRHSRLEAPACVVATARGAGGALWEEGAGEWPLGQRHSRLQAPACVAATARGAGGALWEEELGEWKFSSKPSPPPTATPSNVLLPPPLGAPRELRRSGQHAWPSPPRLCRLSESGQHACVLFPQVLPQSIP